MSPRQSSPALVAAIRTQKFEALVYGEFSFPWGLPADWASVRSIQEAIDLIDRAGVWRAAVAS